TTEFVPPQHDLTPMRWWWEPSHYQSRAGDLILDRILGYSDPMRTAADDFGVALTPQNIAEWTAKTRKGVQDYEQRAPGEAQIVSDRVRSIMETADGSNCGYDEKAAIAGSQAL